LRSVGLRSRRSAAPLEILADSHSLGTPQNIQGQVQFILDVRSELIEMADMVDRLERVRKTTEDSEVVVERDAGRTTVLKNLKAFDQPAITFESQLIDVHNTGRGRRCVPRAGSTVRRTLLADHTHRRHAGVRTRRRRFGADDAADCGQQPVQGTHRGTTNRAEPVLEPHSVVDHGPGEVAARRPARAAGVAIRLDLLESPSARRRDHA
jgi:hypothetical protein